MKNIVLITDQHLGAWFSSSGSFTRSSSYDVIRSCPPF